LIPNELECHGGESLFVVWSRAGTCSVDELVIFDVTWKECRIIVFRQTGFLPFALGSAKLQVTQLMPNATAKLNGKGIH
jgi:hypothetical protein